MTQLPDGTDEPGATGMPETIIVPEAGTLLYTLLIFLTTSCKPCEPFWGVTPVYSGVRDLVGNLVIITPSAAMEDEMKARALVPSGAKLVMNSGMWFDYGVSQAGTVVLTRSRPGEPSPWEVAAQVLGQARPEGPWALVDLVRGWLAGEGAGTGAGEGLSPTAGPPSEPGEPGEGDKPGEGPLASGQRPTPRPLDT